MMRNLRMVGAGGDAQLFMHAIAGTARSHSRRVDDASSTRPDPPYVRYRLVRDGHYPQ